MSFKSTMTDGEIRLIHTYELWEQASRKLLETSWTGLQPWSLLKYWRLRLKAPENRGLTLGFWGNWMPWDGQSVELPSILHAINITFTLENSLAVAYFLFFLFFSLHIYKHFEERLAQPNGVVSSWRNRWNMWTACVKHTVICNSDALLTEAACVKVQSWRPINRNSEVPSSSDTSNAQINI